jgi:hypothetical protein
MRNKVVLVYKDLNNKIAEESVWVQPLRSGYFKIDNVPFYAYNISLNDIISVENENGVLYFDELIQSSGHSTIQIIFFKKSEIILKKLEELNCSWEGMQNIPYYALDIPLNVNYRIIKSLLDNAVENQVLDYKEACLSDNHRSILEL